MANSIVNKTKIETDNQNAAKAKVTGSLVLPVSKHILNEAGETVSSIDLVDNSLFIEENGGTATVTYDDNKTHFEYTATVYCNFDGKIKYLINPPSRAEFEDDKEYISSWRDGNGNSYNCDNILDLSAGDKITLYAQWSKKTIIKSTEWDIQPGSGTYTGLGQQIYNKLGANGVKYLAKSVNITRDGYDEVWAASGQPVWSSEYTRLDGSTPGDYNTWNKTKAVRIGSKDIYNPSAMTNDPYKWMADNISITFEETPYNDTVTWTGFKFIDSSGLSTISSNAITFAMFYNLLQTYLGNGVTRKLKKAVSFSDSNGRKAEIKAGSNVKTINVHSGDSGQVLINYNYISFGDAKKWEQFDNKGVGIRIDGSGAYNIYITYTDIEFE